MCGLRRMDFVQDDADRRPAIEPADNVCLAEVCGERLERLAPDHRGAGAAKSVSAQYHHHQRLIRAIRAPPLTDQDVPEKVLVEDVQAIVLSTCRETCCHVINSSVLVESDRRALE